jgi:hypothetical protein
MEEYQLPSGHVFMGLTYHSRGPTQDSLVVARCTCGWRANSAVSWMTGMNHEDRLEFMGVTSHLDRGRNIHEHGERHLMAQMLRAVQP